MPAYREHLLFKGTPIGELSYEIKKAGAYKCCTDPFFTKQLEIKIFVLLLVVVVRILRAVRRLVLALVLLAAVFAVVVLIVVVLVLVVILIVVLIGIRHFKSLLNVFSYNHIVSFFRNSIQKTGLKILGLLYHFYVEICFILCYINISR